MCSPYISVIINNYNYARFLPDAIHSALAQKNFTDYEIIVVDDASTDYSKEVIASYGDKIIPLYLPQNSGQGQAFNAGFKLSRGKWICFLDADDVFLENKLFQIAEIAKANPDTSLIYHQGYYADKDLQVGEIFPHKLIQGFIYKNLFKTSESLLPPTSFLCFNRTFLVKVLPLDPFLTRIDADFPLQMWACCIGKIIGLREPLGLYRLHGDNWFTNNDFLRLDLDTLKHLMRRAEKAFYYVNSKTNTLGIKPLSLQKNRFYRRNLFIFGQIGWLNYLIFSFFHKNFDNFRDKLKYIRFGIYRRKQFLLGVSANQLPF